MPRRKLKGGDTFSLVMKIMKNYDKFIELFYDSCVNEIPNETWEDLIITNLAFLHRYYLPSYHRGFLQHSAESTLIQLHEYGVYTDNGQGNVCDKFEQQRSYLDFTLYMDDENVEHIKTLVKVLLYDKKIAIEFYIGANDLYGNTVGYEYNQITIEAGRNYGPMPPSSKEFFLGHCLDVNKHFPKWIKSLCFFSIRVKEFCGALADEILLNHIKKIGFPKKFTDPFDGEGREKFMNELERRGIRRGDGPDEFPGFAF